MKHNTSIAILYFSRSVEAESKLKILDSKRTDKSNRKVIQYLDQQTKNVLASTGIPFFQIDENDQVGSTFGEKFANANQVIFEKGFDAVVSVGNDCLELFKLDWKTISQHLQSGHSIIGPSKRNGAYLIGLSRENFDKEKFAKLAWKSDQALEELQSYFVSLGESPIHLETFVDINNIYDVRLLIQTLRLRKNFRNTLRFLIEYIENRFLVAHQNCISFLSYTSLHFRGPPSYSLFA